MKKIIRLLALMLALALIGVGAVGCGVDGNTDDDDAPGYSKGLDENGYIKGVKALDYVTLPEYKGVDITKDLLEPDPAALQYQLDDVLSNFAEEVTDPTATIKDGDTVNIDYVGYVDGVEGDGMNTGKLGTDVTIGVTNYIDDFLEQLIGHHPGENFDIEVTFPDEYKNNPELNGKDAIFNITINHIKASVELTDEIAKECGFDTAEQLITDIEEWLVSSARYYFFLDLVDEAEVSEIPQAVIDHLIATDLADCLYYANQADISLEDYFPYYTDYEDQESYIAANMERYEEDAKFYLAAQAIAEAENLTVTEKQIEEAGHSQYIAEMGVPYLKQYMLFQQVIPEFIALNGNVVEE